MLVKQLGIKTKIVHFMKQKTKTTTDHLITKPETLWI